MASARSALRRALLYVPGSSHRKIEKSQGLSVDCVIYDLEDSIRTHQKSEARANIRNLLNEPRPGRVRERAVRINSIGSRFAEDDLNEVLKTPGPDTLVVPKVNSSSDLAFVTDMVKHHQPLRHKFTSDVDAQSPPIQILAVIESAKAISNLSSICKASPYLVGLIFGAEDFALDLSLTRTPSFNQFLYARSAIVTECRANQLPSVIDLVCTKYKGPEGVKSLEFECTAGKNMGFNGKLCIHPNQVAITQRAFTPSKKEIEWAARALVAAKDADFEGRGAFTVEGQMIDAPLAGRAMSILKRAQECGKDIGDPDTADYAPEGKESE
ncbi:hypothetical protein MMC22_009411 [Lobaria immixta]|nr:hypothetical protein [Lobaria immixta]